MATQEQRLTDLEHFQRETIQAVRDENVHITALMGVIASQGKDIKLLVEQGKEHSTLLREILAKLDERK